MFLGMGIPELIIILVIILVIFGPKNLPKLGASVGKTVKNIREGMGDDKDGKKSDKDDAVEVVAEEDADAPADDDAKADDAKDADKIDNSDDDAASESCFCPKCGTKNPASSDFCTKCGAPLHPED